MNKDDEVKFFAQFAVTLDVSLDSDSIKNITHTWDTLKVEKLSPHVCFSSKEEYLACQEEFGKTAAVVVVVVVVTAVLSY